MLPLPSSPSPDETSDSREALSHDLELIQTQLDALTRKYERLAAAAKNYVATGSGGSVIFEAMEETSPEEPAGKQNAWTEACSEGGLHKHYVTYEGPPPYDTPLLMTCSKCNQEWVPKVGAQVKAPCERCQGSGRLTIYDTAMYPGQACSPIGDEPCPACQPEKASESPDPAYCSACGQEDRDCYCDPSTPPVNGSELTK